MKARIGILVALGLGAVWAGRGLDADVNYANSSNQGLIESLSLIDLPAPGLAGDAVYRAFIAENKKPDFQMGILGSPPPVVPAQMRELVRRGLGTLPLLIQHLDDKRATKLTIDSRFLMWREFDDEYDPRVRSSRPTCDRACLEKKLAEARAFTGAYRVKVGDICFVLIGQIVDRNLAAVRYQATGGLIVNSPIETPSLAAKTRADWGNLDAQSHEASLLADIEASDSQLFSAPALRRLRFYYPNAYAALRGESAAKRGAFEAEESKARGAIGRKLGRALRETQQP